MSAYMYVHPEKKKKNNVAKQTKANIAPKKGGYVKNM